MSDFFLIKFLKKSPYQTFRDYVTDGEVMSDNRYNLLTAYIELTTNCQQ